MVGNFANELKRGQIEDLDGTAFGSKQKPILNSLNVWVEDALSSNRAYKFSLLIQNQYFSIFAQNEQKAGDGRYGTLSDLLFDVNSFFKFESSLAELPNFDTILLEGQETDLTVKVGAREMTGLVLSLKARNPTVNLTFRPHETPAWYLWIRWSLILWVVEDAKAETGSLQLEIFVVD